MNRQFSAGGIVFNDEGKVLVVQNSSSLNWGFPKGRIEPGQTTKEAALREVKEEGGVEAEIIEKVGDTKYVFVDKWGDGQKAFKIVTIYLMKYRSGDPEDHDYEISEAKWCGIDEALKTLSFSSDKTLLKKAVELRNGKPG